MKICGYYTNKSRCILNNVILKKIFPIFSLIFFLFFSIFSYADKISWTYLSPSFHNYSDAIFDAHLSVGGYHDDGGFMDVVTMIQELKRYTFNISRDIFSYKNILPQSALSPTIMMQKSKNLQSAIKIKMDRLKAQEIVCWNKKKLYDTKFYSALNALSSAGIQNTVNLIIENEQCATDARVKFNAYSLLSDKLMYYHNLFSKKYEYRLSLGNY